MDHLRTLGKALGVDPVKALAETGNTTWTKHSATLVIAALHKLEVEQKAKVGRRSPPPGREYPDLEAEVGAFRGGAR